MYIYIYIFFIFKCTITIDIIRKSGDSVLNQPIFHGRSLVFCCFGCDAMFFTSQDFQWLVGQQMNRFFSENHGIFVR